MDLLCKKEEQFSRITTIQPDSIFSVPLVLAHKAALYLRPAGFGFVQNYIQIIGDTGITVGSIFLNLQ